MTGWQKIGSDKDLKNVPQWVMRAFDSRQRSHMELTLGFDALTGRALDGVYEPGLYEYKGKTFRYRIRTEENRFDVYRKPRKSAPQRVKREFYR